MNEAMVSSREPTTRARPSRRLVAALSLGVIALAIGGYSVTGSPSLLRGAATAAAPPPGAPETPESRAASLAQIGPMVDGLAARLKDRPDDFEGWFMLARSYTVLGRFADSLPAYARAAQLQPGNAALLADWADATAAARGGTTHPDATALIARALALDPDQPKALALAGTADYDRGDFAAAARRWQQLADRLPAGSPLRQQVEAGVADAKAKMGSAAAPLAAAPAAPSTAPAVAAKAVSGTVTLAPALAASASPGDTLFVFARAASGPRMPLAIRRGRAAELPLAFRLDDSMAMTPALVVSKADRVVVGARISRSGNATPQPGDLVGESAPVAPGASGIEVRIDRATP